MKRKIIFVCCALMIAAGLAYARMTVIGVTGVVSEPAEDYTDIVFHFTADGTKESTTYTMAANECGPATGTVGSAADVTAGAKYIGDYGLTGPTSADRIEFVLSSPVGAGAFTYSFWFYNVGSWGTYSTGGVVNFRYQDDSRYASATPINDGDSNEFRFGYREDDGGAVNIDTDGADLAAATWYLIVVEVDSTAPSRKVSVYNTSYTLLDSAENTSSFTAPTSGFDEIYIGSSGLSNGVYIDNVVISDLSNTRNLLSDTVGGTRIVALNTCPN